MRRSTSRRTGGRRRVSSSLARQQTLAAPRLAGATAAALAVGLGLITFMLVLNASLDASTGNLLAQRQHADFTIRSTARQGLHDSLSTVAGDLRELPGVATAALNRAHSLEPDGASSDGRIDTLDSGLANLIIRIDDLEVPAGPSSRVP